MSTGKFSKYIHHINKKIAKRENFARIAKVTEVHPGGCYTVETPGGQTLNQLVSTSPDTHFVDQWVTLEFMGGDYSIAGESAEKGGF